MNSREARILASDGVGLPSRQTYLNLEAVRAQKVRLALRAEHGKDWDGKAANDNIAWPLAKALLAEGNTELLKYAMAYRRIYEQAKGEVLIGINAAPAPELSIVYRNSIDESTGRITYGAELVSKAAGNDIPPTVARPTNPDSKKKAAPIPKPWTGDRAINDAIDARECLSWIQLRLGAIREPFEMACIDGATLQEVGNATGVANRGGAMAAGRAIVHLGLITVRDTIGHVNRKDLV